MAADAPPAQNKRPRWADLQDSDDEAVNSLPATAPLLRVQTFDSYNESGNAWEGLNHLADAICLSHDQSGGNQDGANATGAWSFAEAPSNDGAPEGFAWVPAVLVACPVLALPADAACGGAPCGGAPPGGAACFPGGLAQDVNPVEAQAPAPARAASRGGLVRKRCVDFTEVADALAPEARKRSRAEGAARGLRASNPRDAAAAAAGAAAEPPPASEEEWQQRAAKRRAAVAMVKASEEYKVLEDVRRKAPGRLVSAAPRTPDPIDRMSKRRWEEEVRQWRGSLRQWSSERGAGAAQA